MIFKNEKFVFSTNPCYYKGDEKLNYFSESSACVCRFTSLLVEVKQIYFTRRLL